jgi:hypothetical protein
MQTYLYLQRHVPVNPGESNRIELLLATTQCASFPEELDALTHPVCRHGIGDDHRLTVENILGKLPLDVTCFWATEEEIDLTCTGGNPRTRHWKKLPFMHSHWVVRAGKPMRLGPERLSQTKHGGLLCQIAEVSDATHIAHFASYGTPRLLGAEDRIAWEQTDQSWIIRDLEGNDLKTVPAAA